MLICAVCGEELYNFNWCLDENHAICSECRDAWIKVLESKFHNFVAFEICSWNWWCFSLQKFPIISITKFQKHPSIQSFVFWCHEILTFVYTVRILGNKKGLHFQILVKLHMNWYTNCTQPQFTRRNYFETKRLLKQQILDFHWLNVDPKC